MRVKTLTAVEDMDDPIVRNKIVAVAFDKEFTKKDSDEQEHIFRAVGKLAGKAVLPRITQMLEKKSRLQIGRGSHRKHEKLLAIRALEHIDEPETLTILAGLAEDADGLVKSKAQRALLHLQGDGRSDGPGDEASNSKKPGDEA
jgi:HEAT repeat protein